MNEAITDIRTRLLALIDRARTRRLQVTLELQVGVEHFETFKTERLRLCY